MALIPFFLATVTTAAGQFAASGPRIAGLSGASAALAGDHSGLANPAAPSSVRRWTLAAAVSRSFGLPELDHYSLSAAWNAHVFVVGAAVEAFGFDAFRRHAGHLILARSSVANALGPGLRLSYTRLSIEGFRPRGALSATLGLRIAVDHSVALAAFVENAFSTSPPLATTSRRLVLGSQLTLFDGFQILADLSSEYGFSPSARVGAEYTVLDRVALRTGISTSPASFSFGIGARQGGFEAGFGTRRHQVLGWARSVGVGFGE